LRSMWQVLEKLLVTAVSDVEPHIRVAVLECLEPRFDYFLAQVTVNCMYPRQVYLVGYDRRGLAMRVTMRDAT
jgi:hypothetical protein